MRGCVGWPVSSHCAFVSLSVLLLFFLTLRSSLGYLYCSEVLEDCISPASWLDSIRHMLKSRFKSYPCLSNFTGLYTCFIVFLCVVCVICFQKQSKDAHRSISFTINLNTIQLRDRHMLQNNLMVIASHLDYACDFAYISHRWSYSDDIHNSRVVSIEQCRRHQDILSAEILHILKYLNMNASWTWRKLLLVFVFFSKFEKLCNHLDRTAPPERGRCSS